MLQLQSKDIAACFSLIEIQTEIDSIMAAIQIARQSRKDEFQDGQADQAVTRQQLNMLMSELSVWIKAKNILTGSDTATADLIAANYIHGRTI